MEKSNMPDKEFKVMVIKVFTRLDLRKEWRIPVKHKQERKYKKELI